MGVCEIIASKTDAHSIVLHQLLPSYMSAEEVGASDIYLQNKVVFTEGKNYLIKANSGRGKTSLLNIIYGKNTPFKGKVSYEFNNPNLTVFDLRTHSLSYVFQDFKLFDKLSLIENIQLKNTLTKHKSTTDIKEWIKRANLSHKENTLLQHLSLGQRQRVAILRALCQPFKFLLLDEPFSHLDDQNIEIMSNIIKEEIQKQQGSIIMVSLGSEYLFSYDQMLML